MENKETLIKKMSLIYILDILKKYSNYDNRLNQVDILNFLKKDYGLNMERKAVGRNIDYLIDAGYSISYDTIERVSKNKKTDSTVVRKNYYYEHDFDESEMNFLIYGVLFNNYLPPKQRQDIANKLLSLNSIYNTISSKHILMTNEYTTSNNPEIFNNISLISEAITKKKKIEFNYYSFNIDKKLVSKKDDEKKNKDKVYELSPYYIVVANGKYYILGNIDKYDDFTNFRLDKIKNVKILDKKIKDKKYLKDSLRNFNLPKHLLEHPNMFAGEPIRINFNFKKSLLNTVVDFFGQDIELSEARNDEISARVKVQKDTMKMWIMQFTPDAYITFPKTLANEIKNAAAETVKKYK